jgi:hypothetical protein
MQKAYIRLSIDSNHKNIHYIKLNNHDKKSKDKIFWNFRS